ncbi:CheR family methyltransferase [Sphingomonas sp.]
MIAPFAAPPVSAGAIHAIGALLEQRTGQQIAANRMWRVETALKPLAHLHGYPSVDTLVHAATRPDGAVLVEALVEALLNQESSFFRDTGVIEQLGAAISERAATAGARRLRIWSAGCSNGQEPLSIAMMLSAQMPGGLPFPDIQASDVSARAIARARSGRYTQFEVQRGLPVRQMIRWFEQEGDHWVASRELLARIAFRRHNLVADAPLPGRFDVILCRNVLLYFALPVRRQVLAKLAAALHDEGCLVLGASETVIGQTDLLEPCPHFRGFYRRKRASAA